MYRFEHEIFDSALDNSVEDTSFYQNLPPKSKNEHDEVQHTIRGATAGPAVADPAVPAPTGGTRVAPAQADETHVAFGADRTPLFPRPPAPEPEPSDEPEIIFPEPSLDMAPIQVRNDSSQPDVLAHETENAADEDEAARTPEVSWIEVIIVCTFVHHAKLLNQKIVNRFDGSNLTVMITIGLYPLENN